VGRDQAKMTPQLLRGWWYSKGAPDGILERRHVEDDSSGKKNTISEKLNYRRRGRRMSLPALKKEERGVHSDGYKTNKFVPKEGELKFPRTVSENPGTMKEIRRLTNFDEGGGNKSPSQRKEKRANCRSVRQKDCRATEEKNFCEVDKSHSGGKGRSQNKRGKHRLTGKSKFRRYEV